ncbi:MAG: trehalose-6-phosphate synthase [Elusimicrobia bacterium]|nr:trehalose-6-phosphate synthase [Elusimicrobiota bacterium]
MKISFKLITALIVTLAAVAFSFTFFQVKQEEKNLADEIKNRNHLLAQSIQESLEPLLEQGNIQKIHKIAEKFSNREKLSGVAIYADDASIISISSNISNLPVPEKIIKKIIESDAGMGHFDDSTGRRMYVYAVPMKAKGAKNALVLYSDARDIDARLYHMWRRTLLRVIIQIVLISIITLVIIRWSIVSPISEMTDWMKKIRSSEFFSLTPPLKGDIFAPLQKEAATLAEHFHTAKAAAEEEARLRQQAESTWTSQRLKEFIKIKLNDKPLFIISNREPYMHTYENKEIKTIVPAGGLVTALDPIMRISSGTWIAHGSSDADFEVVDENDRVKVPPESPAYMLRRIRLSEEEENGYYYGFSNEGIWPLCHIAHIRPVFRKEDWLHYHNVNKKFAQIALNEIEEIPEPYILVQDYHFALLPAMIKKRRPDARLALFWHIPWPNPETFGICPWQKDLLHDILGADIIGFQTQFYCNNFMDTIDRAMESRIDWEHFAIHREGHQTLVKPFPISVPFTQPAAEETAASYPAADASSLLKSFGLKAEFIGVGVERIDYTKGMFEKFKAIERFLEKHPEYFGKFTFIQIGAPSRTHIPSYHQFISGLHSEVERINRKFKRKDWKPIVFLEKLHRHDEITPYYKAAKLCMVTSLHDGMNLVAKEFAASREDESGVLILSRFTGASRELRDALIVNPYDVEQMADAIYYGLNMPAEEVRERMKRMRQTLRDNNIYKWAATLIEELTKIRIDNFHVSKV